MSLYRLRYFFDYHSGCLWSANEAAYSRFGYPVLLSELPLSEETSRNADRIGEWFDRSLNWDYPADPGPWRQEECDRFNRASAELLAAIRQELASEFDIADEQVVMIEDPDLDEYLADPKGFHR